MSYESTFINVQGHPGGQALDNILGKILIRSYHSMLSLCMHACVRVHVGVERGQHMEGSSVPLHKLQ